MKGSSFLTMFTQILCHMYQISTYSNASCVVNNYICVCEIWFDDSLTVCEILIKLPECILNIALL